MALPSSCCDRAGASQSRSCNPPDSRALTRPMRCRHLTLVSLVDGSVIGSCDAGSKVASTSRTESSQFCRLLMAKVDEVSRSWPVSPAQPGMLTRAQRTVGHCHLRRLNRHKSSCNGRPPLAHPARSHRIRRLARLRRRRLRAKRCVTSHSCTSTLLTRFSRTPSRRTARPRLPFLIGFRRASASARPRSRRHLDRS